MSRSSTAKAKDAPPKKAAKAPKLAPIIPISDTRWFLGRDNSSHWYLVDASRRAEWNAWTELAEDDTRSWNPPAGICVSIDGPHQLTFSLPAVDGKAVTL